MSKDIHFQGRSGNHQQPRVRKQTHDYWYLTHYIALLGLLCSHSVFVLQATQSSCQNFQFPVHLRNQENLQTVNKFVGCKKLTTNTLIMDTGSQQPVIFLINRFIWPAQVEELLTVVLQSKLCEWLIWKTKGRINPKNKRLHPLPHPSLGSTVIYFITLLFYYFLFINEKWVSL